MKRRFIPMLALVFLMPFFSGCNSNAQLIDETVDMTVREITAQENQSVVELINEARSAVVGIYVELYNGYAIGSGVAIEEGGYILTNYHVIEDARSISLYFADKTIGSAEYLWGDPGLDLAIIKSSKNLPYLPTTSVENVSVAEEIYALGTPLTLQFKHTVTKGIVSAKDRVLEVESSNGTSFLQSLIQHDASINPGNSGGALINARGEVIGINTLKATEGEGIGFAIPIDVGRAVVDRISENRYYKEPYLGVFGFDSEIAEIYGEALTTKGVYVVSVSGPSSDKFQKGDVIISVNGKEISNILDLRIAMFGLNSGENVVFGFMRDGKVCQIDVKLGKK